MKTNKNNRGRKVNKRSVKNVKQDAGENQYNEIVRLTVPHVSRNLRPTQFIPQSEFLNHQLNLPFVLASAVNGYVFYELKLNDLFRPDPLVAGNVEGFTAGATRYSIYRVMRVGVSVTVVNNSNVFPITATLIARDAQPSLSIVSYATAYSVSQSSMKTPTFEIPQIGSNNKSNLSLGNLRLGDVVGNPLTYYTEQGYEGTSVLSPTQVVWACVVIQSPAAATFLPQGANVKITFRYHALWHSPQNIIL